MPKSFLTFDDDEMPADDEIGFELFAGPGINVLQAAVNNRGHKQAPTEEVLADALFIFPHSRFLPVRVAQCVAVALPARENPPNIPLQQVADDEDNDAAFSSSTSSIRGCNRALTRSIPDAAAHAPTRSSSHHTGHVVSITVDGSASIESVACFRVLASFASAGSCDEGVRTLVCGHEHAVGALTAARHFVPILAGRMEDHVRLAVLHSGYDLSRLLTLAPLQVLQQVSVPISCAFSHAATTALTFHLQRQHTVAHVQELLNAAPVFFSEGLITNKEAVAVIAGMCTRRLSSKSLATPFIASLLLLKFNRSGYSSSLARDTCGILSDCANAISATCLVQDVLRTVRFTIGAVPGLREAVGSVLATVLREGHPAASAQPNLPQLASFSLFQSPSESSASAFGSPFASSNQHNIGGMGAPMPSPAVSQQRYAFDFPSQDGAASCASSQSQSLSAIAVFPLIGRHSTG